MGVHAKYDCCLVSKAWVPRDQMRAINIQVYDAENVETRIRLRFAADGETIVIAKDAKPMARGVSLEGAANERGPWGFRRGGPLSSKSLGHASGTLAAILLLAAGACSGPVRPVADHAAPLGAGITEPEESYGPPDGAADVGAAADAGPADDTYVMTVREESYETFVDIRPRDRDLPAWDLRPRSKSISLRWDREAPPEEQVGPLREMLGRLLEEYGEEVRAAKLKADLDVFGYPTYVERLARHAAADRAWRRLVEKTRAAGEHRVRDLHGYIVEATRAALLHPELDEVFLPFGLRPKLRGVEKCSSASPASGGVLGGFLTGLGLRGRQPLPVGCLMAWFDLEPACVRELPLE